MNDLAEVFGAVIFTVFVVAFAAALYSFIVCWSWNLCMPYIFGLPKISLWQAFALGMLWSCLTFRPQTAKQAK
jgi:hypothetical protein